MKSKLLLPLALCTAATLLSSGCATQKTHTGRITNILGGFVTIETGDYVEPGPAVAGVDGTKIIGGNASGTSISTFWGGAKYTDY